MLTLRQIYSFFHAADKGEMQIGKNLRVVILF